MRYVLLKRGGLSRGTLMGGEGGSPPHGAKDAELGCLPYSVETLTHRESEEAALDPALLVVPEMRLQLIEPKVRADVEVESAEGAWGLEAVGVTQSEWNGSGVTIAILDTGIDRTHEAFSHLPSDRLIERDFTVDSDDEVCGDKTGYGDQNGHGTHCAGTLFGGTVQGVRIGVAPGIERALIAKVLGPRGGSTTSLVDAINWALKRGANVISMSLGMDFTGFAAGLVAAGYPPDLATSKALQAYSDNVKLFDAIGDLVKRGEVYRQSAIVIAAAGNSSRRDLTPEHVITTEPPAAAEGFVSVGAVMKEKGGLVVAPFSNTRPTVVAPGVNVTSARVSGGLSVMSGTSMATPHVAGVAALWVQYLTANKRRLSSGTLLTRLCGSAVAIDALDVGSGLVRAPPNR